ncbi:hypothetical protein O181_022984 [Austropuccinia psidii MF-1]|uniref:Uncharacterized protein n=1 Tax=Austropuccinia psidii MF-1 TaxID=1389203 RepID=A0A9Q3CDL7_9BASI|nr:hypothetical protein [Austropuccinia psidii MF-1]
MGDSLEGPLTITILIGNNSVEVKLSEKFPRNHPVFPVILIKPYHKTGEDKFPYRNRTHSPQYIVELEESPVPVKKIIKAMNIRLNEKYHRQYVARLKYQTADKDKFLSEDTITDGDLHLIILRSSRRA